MQTRFSTMQTRLAAALGLAAMLGSAAFAQTPPPAAPPAAGTHVHGYTKTLKSGKKVEVKGYTRTAKPAAPKTMAVHGYTRTSKNGKKVAVKGYTRPAPMKGSKKATKPGGAM